MPVSVHRCLPYQLIRPLPGNFRRLSCSICGRSHPRASRSQNLRIARADWLDDAVLLPPSTMSDPRFARLKTDPRFRRIKKDKNKVIVDERFKDIFDDKGRKKGKKDTGTPNNPRGVHTDFRSRTDMISAC